MRASKFCLLVMLDAFAWLLQSLIALNKRLRKKVRKLKRRPVEADAGMTDNSKEQATGKKKRGGGSRNDGVNGERIGAERQRKKERNDIARAAAAASSRAGVRSMCPQSSWQCLLLSCLLLVFFFR